MRRFPFALVFAASITAWLGSVPTASAQSAPATQPQAARWYKGAIHAHSFWSDGHDFPEMVALHYRDKGFNFLCLTDHDVIADADRWFDVDEAVKRAEADDVLDVYTKQWGADWVETREKDGKKQVRLKKFPEFAPRVEKPGEFILIRSEEITDKIDKLPLHMNAYNLRHAVKPQHGDTTHDALRRNLRAVAEEEQASGGPIVVQINHPSFRWGVAAEDLVDVPEAAFVEVANGGVGKAVLGDELHAGDERVWDIANTLRLAEHGERPLYGTASDDSHAYYGKPQTGSLHGWIMVRAAMLEPTALLTAMQAGDFYASTGIMLSDVHYAPATGEYTVVVAPAADAEYTIEFVGTPVKFDHHSEAVKDKDGQEVHATRRYSADVGKVFETVKGMRVTNGHASGESTVRATYKLTGDELYVRARVTSNQPAANPAYKDQLQQAWTQPVGWEKHVRR